MSGLLSMLKSRKAWITLFGVIVSVAGVQLGMTGEQIYTVAGLCALLVLAIASEDAAGKIGNIKIELSETVEERAALLVEAQKVADAAKPQEPKEVVNEEPKAVVEAK